MTHKSPGLIISVATVLMLSCDRATAIYDLPAHAIMPTVGTECDYSAQHDQAFHTIRSANCSVQFAGETNSYTVDYTFTSGAEFGQREAYIIVEWRATNAGETGFLVRSASWHTSDDAFGTTPKFVVKFPPLVDGVAITGYATVCHESEPTAIDCWLNRITAHNDARWHVSRSGVMWTEAIDDVWANIIFANNNENLSPSLDDFVVYNCWNGLCSLDAIGADDPDGEIVEYFWSVLREDGTVVSKTTTEPSSWLIGVCYSLVTVGVRDEHGMRDGLTKLVTPEWSGCDALYY